MKRRYPTSVLLLLPVNAILREVLPVVGTSAPTDSKLNEVPVTVIGVPFPTIGFRYDNDVVLVKLNP